MINQRALATFLQSPDSFQNFSLFLYPHATGDKILRSPFELKKINVSLLRMEETSFFTHSYMMDTTHHTLRIEEEKSQPANLYSFNRRIEQ